MSKKLDSRTIDIAVITPQINSENKFQCTIGIDIQMGDNSYYYEMDIETMLPINEWEFI
jgi:hypothetical protein